ncbi:hypothetical protein AIOL_002916 [Candidatus Rhodobacter oscarellae]|uniref:Uncharacterized protein n=1 Tax=Candidatus Rhodobacter oscarellae TaxID=1675527 RepID=A0A0J9GWN2_9RHOB|nr:SEL1-like repeat protein [Candidatus Rhodobacter lobularis]KMW57948.1 hypothetical protein AIOL_002916 [Candidatus Rhodobacter lobularis]
MLSRLILIVFTCLFSTLHPALAERADPKMQMLFIGASPEDGAPGPLPENLPVIEVDSLPAADAAQQAVFAARLRANPVSTFVAEPSEAHAQFEQFYLVAHVGLASAEGGYAMKLAGEAFALGDFATRVSSLVDAFKPKHRRVGLLRVTDPDDVFPMAIGEVQTALNGLGFDMLVVMIGGDGGASCGAQEALHYSLVSGLADRAPFGDGNGISTAQEVENYLSNALNRQTQRDAACGPRYSVLLKNSNDPTQELVAYEGRSVFTDVETQLYNETFEAMFLLKSNNRDGVQEFLASCLYCPNEEALTDRLREMEEFARSSKLEDEIWQRIKDDAEPARLAIYLENCALCSYEAEVKERIAVLDAKARARDAEASAFTEASEARNLVALRSYTETCVDCAYTDQAGALIASIEADEAYKRETAAFAAAMEAREIQLLSAYLETCEICEGKSAAATMLEEETRRAELAQPCLALAAVPQLGGPRQLEEIDQARALAICTTAAASFPDDPALRTVLGRIAQAAGDYEAATQAYQVGMNADVPAAYGLAAYTHYAPPEGTEIDLLEAEKLATIGADKGDWLSQEILTVLYSKGLVPGRTQEEAFEIAQNIADQGNAMAEFFVGYYYLTGTGVVSNSAQAESWLTKSVNQGYTHAMSFLAEVYENGPTGVPEPEKAAELYWSALKSGDETAADRLTTQLSNRNRDVIRLIQLKLREEGVYRGGADGIAGPGTVTAIRNLAEALVADPQQG